MVHVNCTIHFGTFYQIPYTLTLSGSISPANLQKDRLKTILLSDILSDRKSIRGNNISKLWNRLSGLVWKQSSSRNFKPAVFIGLFFWHVSSQVASQWEFLLYYSRGFPAFAYFVLGFVVSGEPYLMLYREIKEATVSVTWHFTLWFIKWPLLLFHPIKQSLLRALYYSL